MNERFESQAVLAGRGGAREEPVDAASRRLPGAIPVLSIVIPAYDEARLVFNSGTIFRGLEADSL